jgi:hypothetical protein
LKVLQLVAHTHAGVLKHVQHFLVVLQELCSPASINHARLGVYGGKPEPAKDAVAHGLICLRIAGKCAHKLLCFSDVASKFIDNLRRLDVGSAKSCFRQSFACLTLAEARRTADWKRLVGRMRTLLKTMPLGKLQRVGHEDVCFLYEKPGPKANHITLLPGVACHLRERAPLIRRLAQTEWLRFVLSLEQNQPVLGRAVGLSEFLFGSERAALSLKVSNPLRELQRGRCFYCQGSLRAAAAVDHFIPWSRYPRDLAHNLVLAHDTCNSRKSDLLGGEVYLERWAQFLSDHDSDLLAIGTEAGLLVDRPTSVAVAEWSYGHAERVQAEVWLGGTEYGHLSAGWRGLLA